MTEPKKLSPEEYLTLRIDLLFSNYAEQEPGEDLRAISDYFEFLAQRMHYSRRSVDAPADLLTKFESVCLPLRDRLRFYPDTVSAQVERILTETHLERTFAVLGTLSDDDRRRLRARSSLEAILSVLPWLFRWLEVELEPLLNRRAFFDATIALNRLAQIVRYASGIELLDYDVGVDDLRDHYDPALVDKAKIVALVNILRVQLRASPDVDARDRLLNRLDRLEQEVQRSRPRWGRIIAGFFIVLGVAADLKAVNPAAYDAIYRTVQAIVQTLQVDGSVEHHRGRPELPAGEGRPLAILPARTTIREDE